MKAHSLLQQSSWLPAPEQAIVEWLAVAGGPLANEDIIALEGPEIEDAVMRLCARGLCEQKGELTDVRHPLTRDVAYRALERRRRVRMHRKLGELSLDLGRTTDAVREFEAVVAGTPLDPAAAHYDLAKAYLKAGKSSKAEEQVFLALEAAPGYKPAQKLMLELNGSQAGQKEKQ